MGSLVEGGSQARASWRRVSCDECANLLSPHLSLSLCSRAEQTCCSDSCSSWKEENDKCFVSLGRGLVTGGNGAKKALPSLLLGPGMHNKLRSRFGV